MKPKKRIILIVQDGWGIAKPGPGNCVDAANTPIFDDLIKNYPHCVNQAAGEAVGLPKGAQGNSEVGHLHLGAGRIVWQMYEKVNNEIENGNFEKNVEILKAMKKAKKTSLHLMGLCSNEGVHSHIDHLLALLDIAVANEVKNIYIHFFADGRDVAEKSAEKYVATIQNKLREIKVGKIVSIVGRYYAMDRDNNWDRTQKAYDLLTKGKGYKAKSPVTGIKLAYKRGDKTDYYIQPTVLDGFTPIKDKDVVIFFNFRTDRPRQLTEAFISKKFDKFAREFTPKVYFLAMTRYKKSFDCPIVYEEEEVTHNLGAILAENKLKQLRLAETEKYGHVTYFFNSQIEKQNVGEDRILIPSAKVLSYDEKPEMSAYEINKKAIEKIKSKKYDFILINFANCDLVGHSAIKPAIIKAVEVVDECTGNVVKEGIKNGYDLIVTADHGSAEEKTYPDGKPKPAHSTNPINFILVTKDKIELSDGGQKDVAPTVLELMGYKKPEEMTGNSLIKHNI